MVLTPKQEKPALTTATFPCDLDTTSIGLMTTQPSADVFKLVMDEMLTYRTGEGIILVRATHTLALARI